MQGEYSLNERARIATDGSAERGRGWRRLAAFVILAGILLIGAQLRFTGLNWDEGQYIHPDEGHMRNTLSLIRWPDDVSVYFNTHTSPLNVRNREGQRYSYGTLPLFAVRAAAEWLDGACTSDPAPLAQAAATVLVADDVEGCGPGTFTGSYNAVVGRTLSALSDLGTLILIYLIGRRLYGEVGGLMAAALGAVTAFMIQQAHFFTVESMACFFVTSVAYFSLRASGVGEPSDSRVGAPGRAGVRWGDFALAGICVGLASACKVSAATSALLVVLAAVQSAVDSLGPRSPRQGEGVRLGSVASHCWMPLIALCLAGLLSLVAFRVGQPYAFEGPGFFGVAPSPEWFGRLQQIRLEQSGQIDLPSGRQWANRMPILFPWLNIVVWGMGIPLGLAGWIGWGVAGYQLLSGSRRGRRHLVLWGWFTLVFFYQATQWVKSMRYFLVLYPVLLLFAAGWLTQLLRSASGWRRRAGLGLSTVVGLGAVFWGVACFTIYLRPHPRVAASRWIYEHVPEGSTVANEHWDWGLPLRIDGHDPFGNEYDGIEMTHYDEDTPQKRTRLYDWLDKTEWIFLASNRLYASIPRLPARYPLTTEYYRALFAGDLGFELAADFTSYPALGPFLFPDQENPFELMEADFEAQTRPITINLPAAEEAFSVYDHPRVLIFRKTDRYSTELMQQILGKVDLERVQQGRTPREATEAPNMLRFSEAIWADQRAGGTWSEMFNRDGPLNRHPGLAALAWWAVVTSLGWLAFPLLFASLPALRDRGYGFSRLLALLIVAYLTWLAASMRLFPNTRATILRMVALLAVSGGGVAWLRRDNLKTYVRKRWRVILLTEALFALLFGLWIGVRMLQPDLWHPVVGGEKPMDFAYLNAVMKSTWFPPYNPWLSGTWINYYYFGFVIVGTLIKLLGTVPAIAYNLTVPLLFALTGIGAFSAAYNLSGGDRSAGHRRPLIAGVAGLVFCVLVGNLGVVHLIRSKLIALGDISFPSTIPGFPNTVSFFRGLWLVIVKGNGLTMRPETWYWHPTRIIPETAGNPIAEFPAFTFLYGDLHPHMIAFPLTLFALALVIAWARGERPGWGSLLLGAVVIGALRPTNTWDYPTYLLMGALALGMGAYREAGSAVRHDVGRFFRRAGWRVGVLSGMTVLLYLPYIRHYASGYSAIELWKGGRTPLGIYLWITGGLLFPVVTRMIAQVVARSSGRRLQRVVTLLAVGTGLVLGTGLWLLGIPVGLVAVPLTALALLLFFFPAQGEMGAEWRRADEEGRQERGLLWVLVAGAMMLSLAVELVVLEGDIGRMNTVFKFYLQVWILLSISAAVSLAWVWGQIGPGKSTWHQLWWLALIALAIGGALFLPFGVRARAMDRMAAETGLTLDGMAFIQDAVVHDGPEDDMEKIALSGDYYAIHWMQDHIEGSPVILEGLGRREYLWANRVSLYTGLPAVVGWRWHQVQQRAGAGAEMVEWRRNDVNTCYSTASIEVAGEILARYDVRYVYVGGYEQAYYAAAGLEKFAQMAEAGVLQAVYDAHDVVIYEVLS